MIRHIVTLALLLVLASASLLFGSSAMAADIDGNWRGLYETFSFQAKGPILSGSMVDLSGVEGAIEKGQIDGKSLSFSVSFGTSTHNFTGVLSQNEIKLVEGPGDKLSSRRFPGADLWVAGELILRKVRGELYSTALKVDGHVDVAGTFVLPPGVRRIRGVIAIVGWGVGYLQYFDPTLERLAASLGCGLLRFQVSNGGVTEPLSLVASDQAVRNAAVGGGEGLLMLLDRFAQQSGHKELKDAKLLTWGHSAAGSFALTFATQHPERTIAFVRYHSHLRGLTFDLSAAAQIPGLLLAGEKDTTAGVQDSEALWKKGRSVNAPWTFAIEPGATHGSAQELSDSNALQLPWITAVFRHRVAGGVALRPVLDESGWLVNNESGEIRAHGSFGWPKPEASWVPDKASAQGWRVVSGFR
jgi:hypothetical protein